MRFLHGVHGHLAYTYRQKQTTEEVRREMLHALGCMETGEFDDEEQDDDDLLPV